MKPLRERIFEDLQLKGYNESTQKLYVGAVCQLCERFNKPPGRISEENLRDYFLHAKMKKNALAAPAPSLCAASNSFSTTPSNVFGQHYRSVMQGKQRSQRAAA